MTYQHQRVLTQLCFLFDPGSDAEHEQLNTAAGRWLQLCTARQHRETLESEVADLGGSPARKSRWTHAKAELLVATHREKQATADYNAAINEFHALKAARLQQEAEDGETCARPAPRWVM